MAGLSVLVRNSAGSLTLATFIYPMSEELGWSRSLIAGAASLGGLAASAASPLVGWMVDRYGARTVLTVAVLVLGLSTFSLAWATVPIAFYVALATGRVIFSSPIQIASTVVVSRWFVRLRGRATGLLFMSHAVGMSTFPLLSAFVIANWGWPRSWMVLGVLVWVLGLIPVSLLVIQRPEDVGLRPDGDPQPAEEESKAREDHGEVQWSTREAIRTAALWVLALAGGALFMVQAGVNIHLGAFFRDQGLSIAVSTLGVSLNGAFMGVGSLFWGWLVERAPVRYVYAATALLMGVVAALFPMVDAPWKALALSAAMGAGLGGSLVVPSVAYAQYFGRRSLGTIRGLTEPFVSLGQAVGAILSGVVFDLTGSYTAAFLAFGALAGATAVATFLTRRPRHPRSAASAS